VAVVAGRHIGRDRPASTCIFAVIPLARDPHLLGVGIRLIPEPPFAVACSTTRRPSSCPQVGRDSHGRPASNTSISSGDHAACAHGPATTTVTRIPIAVAPIGFGPDVLTKRTPSAAPIRGEDTSALDRQRRGF
jgi:hypothetical protein